MSRAGGFFERLVIAGEAEHVTRRLLTTRSFTRAGGAAPVAVVRQFTLERFRVKRRRRRCSTPTGRDSRKPSTIACRPAAVVLPEGHNFRLQKLFLKTIGRLSQGVAIGWASGFDSGDPSIMSIKTAPRHLAAGPADRLVLSEFHRLARHPAAQGEPQATAPCDHRPVAIQDRRAASGYRRRPGALHAARCIARPERPTSRRCSAIATRPPWTPAAGWRGRWASPNVAFESGDAFDACAGRVTPQPTIAVVSGLYELFPDNEPVLPSLRGLADAHWSTAAT